jgi:hypothetical protein
MYACPKRLLLQVLSLVVVFSYVLWITVNQNKVIPHQPLSHLVVMDVPQELTTTLVVVSSNISTNTTTSVSNPPTIVEKNVATEKRDTAVETKMAEKQWVPKQNGKEGS